jgi:heme/copper-type cytochrome/quinol oxidase subunit 2
VALSFAAAVLIILVVVASRSVTVVGDAAQVNQGPVIAIVHAIEIVGIAIEVLAIILWLVVSRMARREENDEDTTYHEPPKVHWIVKLVVIAIPLLFLGLILYALYRYSTSDKSQIFDLSGLLGPMPADNGPTSREVAAVFGLAWWEYAISFGLVIAVLGVIVWAFRRDVRTGVAPEESPSRVNILSHAVDLGLKDARAERDPRKAVIAAYATMERILAEEGLPRQRTEAPLEYMSRIFAELGVGKEAIFTLTELFEVARFSHHPVLPAMKEHAIAALETLRRDLRLAP